jgi:hypothetical protein
MISKSQSIASIVGPTLVLMVASELKLWNPGLYDEQITPLIYLSGVLLFIAGLAIAKIHNIWVRGWQTSLTVFGWFATALGASRMFFPQAYKENFKNDITAFAVEITLILFGLFLTFKAYWPIKKAK